CVRFRETGSQSDAYRAGTDTMTQAAITGGQKPNTRDFLKEKAGMFKEFSDERLQQLVDGSRVGSFEANEAIAHQGAEATHFGVVLSGTVSASVLGNGS